MEIITREQLAAECAKENEIAYGIIREDEIRKLSDTTLCRLIFRFKYGFNRVEAAAIESEMEKELAIRWKGDPTLNKETHPHGRMTQHSLEGWKTDGKEGSG